MTREQKHKTILEKKGVELYKENENNDFKYLSEIATKLTTIEDSEYEPTECDLYGCDYSKTGKCNNCGGLK